MEARRFSSANGTDEKIPIKTHHHELFATVGAQSGTDVHVESIAFKLY